MTGPSRIAPLGLEPDTLGRLMPMYVWISPEGIIAGHGPTLGKATGGQALLGCAFTNVFAFRRPAGPVRLDALADRVGERLHLTYLPRGLSLRGVAVPLANKDGFLLNLSFGIGVADAVRDFALTDADFAPTDLAIEMLYLAEAKTAVVVELKNLNERLQGAKSAAEEQANTDMLTGLRNRRALDQRLGELIAQEQPFGLMHMDLDFFKAVNDTLGHAAGDHVLRAVAQVLRRETRAGDHVARVGGDEFVMLFPGLDDRSKLETIAARMITRVGHPIAFEGDVCRISASIGISISTIYAEPTAAQMQADADAALYASKHAGRGRAQVFEAEMRAAKNILPEPSTL